MKRIMMFPFFVLALTFSPSSRADDFIFTEITEVTVSNSPETYSVRGTLSNGEGKLFRFDDYNANVTQECFKMAKTAMMFPSIYNFNLWLDYRSYELKCKLTLKE